jgi:GNAT superfamily N-acetyltransferase
MNVDTAQAIAELINDRNKLTKKYPAEKVLDAADNYICRFASDGRLVGVVEAKRVQWYQCEIDHLSVRADAEGEGVGSWLLKSAETRAVELRTRIAQCTIRVGNEQSEGLFRKFGYLPTVSFFNIRSGNDVTVYQKALVTR